jgi:hypothetical protein
MAVMLQSELDISGMFVNLLRGKDLGKEMSMSSAKKADVSKLDNPAWPKAVYEADFLDCSYGFRPERNCHQAINAVDKTIMTNPINHVIEADIKGCFDMVSHQWMMEFLQDRIQDPRVREISGALSTVQAEDCAQLIYAIAGCVSLTEETDVGNLQVRFCEGH